MSRIICLLSIVSSTLSGCNHNGEFVKPEIKPLLEAVYASGYVVSENEYQAFSQVDGYIAEKLVNDGDSVKKNDPIFIIEAEQQNARYRIAKENYDLAVRNLRDDSPVLNELKGVLQSAKTKKQYDSINLVRYTNLLSQNATSKAEYDRVKLLYDNSKNDYRLAESRLKKTIDQLTLELKNAENQIQISRDESARYIIRSKVDGVVLKTFKEKGELIRRTEVIAVLGSNDSFYLQLSIDELDIHRIRIGQKVLVKIDAYPNQVFTASVSRVYPLVDSRQQSLRVDARLIDTLPGSFSGLALEANIVIRETEKAMVIPKRAVLPGDSVILKNGNDEKRVKVLTGISSFDEIEILEGIDSTSMIKVNGLPK